MEEVKTEDKKWYVYMHTNKINNKVYVGQTCKQPPEKRWGKNGCGYKRNGGNLHFKSAIKKYGWENFEHIIFADNLTKEEADHMETLLIALYETTNQDKGYNIAVGGSVHIGIGKNNPFYGKHHTEETKRILSEIRSIPVVQLNLSGEYIAEFSSGKEAALTTNIDATTINDCCMGKPHCKSGGGYLWVYKKDYNPDIKVSYQNEHFTEVIQLDTNGNFIAEYTSIKEASQVTGTHNTGIIACCRGRYKVSGGFKWMYKKDWEEIQGAV